MIAVTTASAAWTETAAITAVAVPCYLIWLYNFLRTGRLPSESAGQPNAADQFPLAVGGTSFRRGQFGCETDSALARESAGDEFDEIEFYWPDTPKEQS